MLYENRRRIIQVLLLGLFIVVFLVVLSIVIKLLTTGTITVTTASQTNFINLNSVVGGKNGTFSQRTQGNLSARVKPGNYEITVYNSSGRYGTSQIIHIKARQHISLTLNPLAITNPEPVYGDAAGSVFSDGKQLLFIALSPSEVVTGSEDGNIIQANASGVTTLFPYATYDLSSVDWVNSSVGLAQDSVNNLYVISGGTLTQIALPFSVTSSTKLSSAMDKEGDIYVSNGRDVYVGSSSGGFKKIYSAPDESQVSDITAGNGDVAVLMGEVEALESVRNGSQPEGYIAIVNNSGQHSQISTDVNQIAWSPSYKYLIAEGDLSTAVYSSSLHQVNSVAINNSNNFTWQNDNALFYSIANQLWLYNLQTARSTELTTLALGQTITGIYPSTDGSYVYFTENNTEESQLFRVGLRGQPVDNSLTALSIFMPESVDDCLLEYVNFIQNTILIDYPAATTQEDCQTVTDGQLQTYGLDASRFQYSFSLQSGD